MCSWTNNQSKNQSYNIDTQYPYVAFLMSGSNRTYNSKILILNIQNIHLLCDSHVSIWVTTGSSNALLHLSDSISLWPTTRWTSTPSPPPIWPQSLMLHTSLPGPCCGWFMKTYEICSLFSISTTRRESVLQLTCFSALDAVCPPTVLTLSPDVLGLGHGCV